MRRRPLFALLSVLALSPSRAARSQQAPPARAPVAPNTQTPAPPRVRNVILLTVDSLRADMPWAGYARPIAPNLTALAARAVQYTHAYSLSSYTSMSVGSFLGGRYASELRRDAQFFARYTGDNLFFPEVLQRGGIFTTAAHAHFYFRAGYAGFEQGFDHWELLPNLRVDYTTDLEITSDRHEATAERLLTEAAQGNRRFFGWFHFMDPHDRYLRHPGIDYGMRNRDLYDGEVTFADRALGRLLTFIAAQPWGAQTAILVSADHGEAFGEHGATRHGFEVWEPLVRVPWLIVLPGVAPRVIDTPRSALDLAPTVLDLLGLQPEPSFHGNSLLPELQGGPTPERDVVVDLPENVVSHRRRALVHGHLCLLAFDADARFELYDLQADPTQSHSLRTTQPALFAEMLARYRAFGQSITEYVPRGLRPGERAH